MTIFLFYRVLEEGGRLQLAVEDLDDRETARTFAIDLAGYILEQGDPDRFPARSRIAICNAAGEELDTIISEGW